MQVESVTLDEEERLVAELECLGIRYLSRQTAFRAEQVRLPADLLAGLIRQPSARVREAVIAVLLAHPEYAAAVPDALNRLTPVEQTTLRFFYTASVLLQQQFADELQRFVIDRWQRLPDLFSNDLGLPIEREPREPLIKLGQTHRRRTKAVVNWTGTYENVARKLARARALEQRWSQCHSEPT
jgi:hypothetical protein